MKNIKQAILILSAFSLTSGCVAYHNGYMISSASLQSNNFEYVKFNCEEHEPTFRNLKHKRQH